MFNAGVRGKRAKDGVGFLSAAEQFNQKSFLVPTVTSFSVTDVSYVPLDNTAVDTAGGETIVINGSGFASGATVQVGATTIGSVTFIDQNRLAFAAPALSSGSYTIYVTNSNGGTGILVSGLVYSGLPTYSTSAGSLGTVYETANINTAVVATGDAPITYSVISGTLPSGATLNSNGTITGNAPVDGSSTTYSFTIQASDGQLQDSTRSFSLTINTDVLSWGLANNTVYPLEGNSVMSNVTLSATSTANSNSAVTFSANTLPTGVSLSGNTIFGTPTVEQTVYSALTATATQTGRTATRFVSWSVSLGDPYWKNVSLLLTGNSPVDTFVTDASTNNFAVSIVGDTKPNNFNPNTPGYYSNFFDGTGDRLVLATNASLNLTDDFTIEMWVNLSSLPAYSALFNTSLNGGAGAEFTELWVESTGTVAYYARGSVLMTTASGIITANTWHHIAVVKSGTSQVLYVNGVSRASATSSTQPNTGYSWVIGDRPASAVSGQYPSTGHISNFRIVKGTAVYTSAFTPSTTPLTAITNTSLLTCHSNRLIDTSTNAFAVTRNGDVAVRQINPFIPDPTASTYGSAFFDGTGDYLSIPNNTALQMSTGDFTVEMWFYTQTTADQLIFDMRPSLGNGAYPTLYYTAGALVWFNLSADRITSGAIAQNTWYHVAISRSGTSTRMFINGVQAGSTYSDTTNYLCDRLFIGASSSGSGAVSVFGYISNVRIVKGTAVYTAAFTPPTAPLTAITNTSLLTLQTNQAINNNLFIDDSTNNFAVTRAGNTTQGTFSPYGANWSNYFDASGDYLSLSANSAFDITATPFTVECWIYRTVGSTPEQYLFSNRGTGVSTGWEWRINSTNLMQFFFTGGSSLTSTGTIPVNTWTHLAASRDSNTFRFFINGALDSTTTFANGTSASATGLYLGYGTDGGNYFPGYMSNARLVKGTAVYTASFTPSTTPLTAITNTSLLTCQSNRVKDNSTNNFAITKNGDVSVQRFSPFNPSAAYSLSTIGGSGYFDGAGDYLSMSSSSAPVASQDFTIECWYYPITKPTIYGTIYGNFLTYSASGIAIWDRHDSWPTKINVQCGGVNATSTTSVVNNTWYHIAVTRASGTLKLYINGVLEATTASANSSNTPDASFIGRGDTASLSFTYINAYVSNFRIVKDTAVYTANFTPPTAPVTAITNTSLLLNFTDAGVVDNAMLNNLETFGDARVSRAVSKFGSGAMYFDGTGDYLFIKQDNPALRFGTAPFTIECWVYLTSTVSSQHFFFKGSLNAGGVFFTRSAGNAGKLAWYVSETEIITTSSALSLNQWTHIAYVRTSTSASGAKIYINGVSSGTGTDSTNYTNTDSIAIGAEYAGTNPMTGYIDDYRITTGVARYTANFTPPISALQTK